LTDEVRMLAAFLVAACATLLATPYVIRLANRTGFLDRPHTYKGHARATPYLGGLAVVAGALLASVLFTWGSAPDVLRWALATSLLLCVLGTVDDRLNLGAGIRVLLTAGVAAILWLVDAGWNELGHPVLNLTVTILWVLAVVNAFNLMDNMDGANPVTTACAAAGLAAVAVALDRPAWAITALAICGACLAFLRFNLRRPSRIFLGDGGSMALGFLMATLPMTLMAGVGDSTWKSLIPCVLLVGLPALDTALVVVSRRRRDVPVLSGGRDHLTHRLRQRLGEPWRVALVLAAGQLVLGFAAWAIFTADTRLHAATLAGIYLCVAAIVIWRFEHPSWAPRPARVQSLPAHESAGTS
jgi:UDP-GlcNAc:undecaprenyl-phosphate GlcNAc-1-phosphate transferase